MLDFKGSKYTVVDSDVVINFSFLNSMYCDGSLFVRFHCLTNAFFSLDFMLKFCGHSCTFFFLDQMGFISHKSMLDLSNENYSNILKLKLMSNSLEDYPFFEYSVELLRQILPAIVDNYKIVFDYCNEVYKEEQSCMVVL